MVEFGRTATVCYQLQTFTPNSIIYRQLPVGVEGFVCLANMEGSKIFRGLIVPSTFTVFEHFNDTIMAHNEQANPLGSINIGAAAPSAK